MLYIVLLLVLSALGLLIAALTTANTLWAWLSVGLSVAAAAILVLDWLRSRRSPVVEPEPAVEPEPLVEEPVDEVPDQAVERPADVVPEAEPVSDDADVEPAEESTDAADILVISTLTVEVRVLDERPRYHLSTCGWLGSRPSIPLPISEARELGFTPCARCTPDAALAARHKTARVRTQGD